MQDSWERNSVSERAGNVEGLSQFALVFLPFLLALSNLACYDSKDSADRQTDRIAGALREHLHCKVVLECYPFHKVMTVIQAVLCFILQKKM